MSDTKTGDDKTLSVKTKKTLTLKRPAWSRARCGRTSRMAAPSLSSSRPRSASSARPDEKPEAGPAVALFKPKVRAEGRPWRRSPVVQEAPKAPQTAAERARRHGAERTVERRDGSAPQGARRLESSRGRGSPPRRRRGQAPRRGGRAPPPRARGIRAPPGRGRSAPAGRGRSPPPRRGRSAPPRAAGRELATADDDEEAKPQRTGARRPAEAVSVTPEVAQGRSSRPRARTTAAAAS